MIDFDALVLGPAMDAFARDVTVTPKNTATPAYVARGVYSERPIDIQIEGEGIMSSKIVTLGFRLSELTSQLSPGDRIDIPADGSSPARGAFVIDDTDDDGQGGTIATLKAVRS